jgi:hypothetical protein
MMEEDNYKSANSADLEGGDDGGDQPAADEGEAMEMEQPANDDNYIADPACADEEPDSESEDKTFI